MESNHAFVDRDDILDGSSNSCKSTLNDRLLAGVEDNLNIATMSDFQFSESLDALIDSPYIENVPAQFPSPSDVPTCFDVDEATLVKPPEIGRASCRERV